MKATRLCLIRHGETAWNAERRLQGQTDIPLNAHGEQQARQLAQALQRAGHHFDALYSSDLSRARATAAPITASLGLTPILLPDLRERHMGALQGVTVDEAPQRWPQHWQALKQRELQATLGDGESLQQLVDRVQHALARLVDEHCGQQLLLVSHGGVLDVVYRLASDLPLHGPRSVAIPNAALNWLLHDGKSWKIESWAEQQHLPHSLDEL